MRKKVYEKKRRNMIKIKIKKSFVKTNINTKIIYKTYKRMNEYEKMSKYFLYNIPNTQKTKKKKKRNTK